MRSSKEERDGDKADRMACAIQSRENPVKSAVSFLRLARRAMSSAMTTMPTTVADIDTDAWQAQAAASHQYRSQYNGHGPDHHRRLRFHWNTPEFPDVRHSTAPGAQYPMLHQWATAHSCGGARQSRMTVSRLAALIAQQALIPTRPLPSPRDIPRQPLRNAAEWKPQAPCP